MMNADTIKQLDKQYVVSTYARFDVVPAKGKGATCTDMDGKEYVDFSSGIGVNSLGFCDETWADAVCEQVRTLQHISNLYYTAPCANLAQALCTKTGMQRVFFANSGAEANEAAIKTARKYSSDKYGEGRHEIITLENSFHGRTVTTLSATGQAVFHRHFHPFTDGFLFARANDIKDLTAKISSKTCAIFIELIQGEGGVVPLTQDYVTAIAKICEQQDILLMIDEVQTGIGRTGKLFCYEHYGLSPDVVTAAKGLGGGLPIGAVLFGEKTADTLGAGDHGTTFGGNPVAAAGALAVLSRIDDVMLSDVCAKGEYAAKRLLTMPKVQSVTGKGLMLGIEITGADSKTIAAKCIESGLIILTAKHKLRILCPLTITMQELDKGLTILETILTEG